MSTLNYINKELAKESEFEDGEWHNVIIHNRKLTNEEVNDVNDDYIENYVKPMLQSLETLYYIVYEGTNKRILNFDHTPFICSGDVINDKLSFYEAKIGQPLEYIQVDEYQSVFGRYEA